jgi:hypothetical protein
MNKVIEICAEELSDKLDNLRELHSNIQNSLDELLEYAENRVEVEDLRDQVSDLFRGLLSKALDDFSLKMISNHEWF